MCEKLITVWKYQHIKGRKNQSNRTGKKNIWTGIIEFWKRIAIDATW